MLLSIIQPAEHGATPIIYNKARTRRETHLVSLKGAICIRLLNIAGALSTAALTH
jgi:hypothetical protein